MDKASSDIFTILQNTRISIENWNLELKSGKEQIIHFKETENNKCIDSRKKINSRKSDRDNYRNLKEKDKIDKS